MQAASELSLTITRRTQCCLQYANGVCRPSWPPGKHYRCRNMRGSRGRLEGLDAAQLHEAHELAEGADTLGGEGAAAMLCHMLF